MTMEVNLSPSTALAASHRLLRVAIGHASDTYKSLSAPQASVCLNARVTSFVGMLTYSNCFQRTGLLSIRCRQSS